MGILHMKLSRSRQVLILASPIILYILMGVIFAGSTRLWGKESGYLLGFASYWLIFGIIVPVMIFKKQHYSSLLRDRAPLFSRQNWLAALLWIIIAAVSLVMYGRDLFVSPLVLILVAVPPAVVNGFCEEIFWRGVFVKCFSGNPWLGVIYPAVAFSLWHLIPQSVFPSENAPGFILSTFFLGLAYGFIAYRTGSARWTAFSHSLSGVIALSGMIAPTFLKLISQ